MRIFFPAFFKRIILLAIVSISQKPIFSQTISYNTLANQSTLSNNSGNLFPLTSSTTTFIENVTNTIVALSAGADARLSTLIISTGTLTPAFASGTNSYTSSVSNTTSSITVTPTSSDANATIKVNGSAVVSGSASSAINLSYGANTINIVVTAQDGNTTQTYTVIVSRQFPPPTIVTTGSLNAFTSCKGIVSNSQSVTVSGTNLISNVIISVPTGFEISLTSSGNYQNNLSLPISNNNVSETTIYARLANNASGTILGNLSFSSGNATTQNIAIKGTVNPFPATPTVTAGASTTFCQGGSVILTSSASSGNQWFLNGSAINGATAITYSANSSGDYTVQSTNNNGCQSAASLAKTVTVNPLPATLTIATAGTTIFCTGGSVLLISGTASNYLWFRNGSLINGATSSTYTANTSGDYTVRTFNNSGCISVASPATTVTVNLLPVTPTISTATATTFCNGGSVVLISNASSGNQWYSNGAAINGATAISYTADVSGNYTVQTTNNNGCASAVSTGKTVTVNPLPATPALSPANITSFCIGGSVVLSSNATSGNHWFRDGNSINGATAPTYSANSSGNYTVQTTNNNGCVSAVSNVTTVTVNSLPPTPAITAGSTTTFCTGGSVVLSSNATSGNQWFRNGVAINGATEANYAVNSSGNYTVKTNNNDGCVSLPSAAATVTVNPLPATPAISAGSTTTFCIGGSVILTSNATSGNQWFSNGAAINGATAAAYKANNSGDYTVQTTNNNGCASALSTAKTVTVNPLPVAPDITAGSTTSFCNGGSVILTSSASSGNHWFRNGIAISGATAATYKANTSGDYTVQTTNNNGCISASAAVTVTVNQIPTTPTISAGSTTTFCSGGSVVFTSSSSSGNNQWFLNGAAITGAITTTYTATTSGNYTVQTTSNGCVSAMSPPKTVTVKPLSVIPVITPGSSTTFCIGGSVILTSSAASGNHWLYNGAAINGANAVTYKANTSGDYAVQITNTNGCISPSAAITVTVNPLPDSPRISAGSTTTFCNGGSVVLTSNSASGNKWFLNGIVMNSDTTTTYIAAVSGNYTVQITNNNGCVSAMSAPINISVIPNPAKPTFSWNGSVLTSDSKSDQLQWKLNGNPIPGENSITLKPQSIGNITLQVTNSFGCTSVSDVYILNSLFTSTIFLQDNLLRLFPNPSSNEVWLEFSKELTSPVYVQLFTYSGVLLQKFSTTKKLNKILLETYAQGHYYITVGNGTDKITLPITKANN